jgi:uncharacterized membrane protein
METIKQNSRSLILDVLRGFTVVLMIIFHFSFDLDYFGFISIDIVHHPFWYFFPRLIVFNFLLATGMSLTLVHQKNVKWKSFFKRLALLIFWAAIISGTTYFMFPDSWIYFGTLHAIAVISCLSLPFLQFPKISVAIAAALFIPSIFFDVTIPWYSLPHSSWDYISPFPWLGASLLGIFAVHKGMQNIQLKHSPLANLLKFLGQHSLVIYLIHQPILFGLLGLVAKYSRS